MSSKALFILTSCDTLGDTGERTGFHFEEMSTPYYILTDAGVGVDLASVKGGKPPADPGSLRDNEADNPESVQRFHRDKAAMQALENTIPVSQVNSMPYDVIFLPGGHGTMWDFPNNPDIVRVLEQAYEDDKIISAVCHGPAAFVGPEADGKPIIDGKEINSFTDDEEREVDKADVMPFMLESKLADLGAKIVKAGKFESIVVESGNFITGQNPPSAEKVANAIVRQLQERRHKQNAA